MRIQKIDGKVNTAIKIVEKKPVLNHESTTKIPSSGYTWRMGCAKLSTSIYKSILVMALVVMYPIGVYAESVAHRFESDEPETRTENILYLAAGTALSSIGFSSTREARGSDFILHTRYTQHNDEISVLYTLYSNNERILSERSLVAPLDHQLDIRIGETLAELFGEAEARGYSEDAGISDLFSWKQDASGPVAPDPRSSPAFVFESGAEIGGVVFFGEKVSSEHTQLEQMIHHEASAREIAVQREEEALTVLGRVSDFRDEETGQHQRRIGRVSVLFGTYLGMTVADQRKLLYGAPLHDIGKIAIPDAILQKPGPLTEEEMTIMKTHPMIGFELLEETRGKYLAEGATIALTHHEKWDGTGYPNGLAGEKTPLSGRIVGLADVLDALFSERVYKRAWSVSEVMDYVQEQKGKHFDPRLVDVFLEHKELFLQVLLEK